MRIFLLHILLSLLPVAAFGSAVIDDKSASADADTTVLVPMVKVSKALYDGDSIMYMEMSNVYVYPPPSFKNKRQQVRYMRLVRNVKTVLPIAKEVNQIIIETYEYLQTLPDDESRKAHMKNVEKSIFKEYKPRMKKLTYSQGKLLIKLIYRECNSSSYDILRAFLGPVRAGFWQAFSSVFGASLRKEYEPDGVDRLTECVVLMVEAGQI